MSSLLKVPKIEARNVRLNFGYKADADVNVYYAAAGHDVEVVGNDCKKGKPLDCGACAIALAHERTTDGLRARIMHRKSFLERHDPKRPGKLCIILYANDKNTDNFKRVFDDCKRKGKPVNAGWLAYPTSWRHAARVAYAKDRLKRLKAGHQPRKYNLRKSPQRDRTVHRISRLPNLLAA